MSIFQNIFLETNKKRFAVLIDPDRTKVNNLKETAELAKKSGVDVFFVGGSLLTNDSLDECITLLKEETDIPVIIFPGNAMQINAKADALLFLSLISSRNPEMLIGRHVIAAPYLKAAKLETISTGYMLIDSGKSTAASYMSNSFPIPYDKDDIAVCTAMAGEMLGLKLIYMDAGSGSASSISETMTRRVKDNIDIPLIVGGGIRNIETAKMLYNAGADCLVIGNAIEKDNSIIREMSDLLKIING
ncbi:MAG: geranylgeranylglyceryl/heptaprenylglyceryl phosphate synthase [Bacteroidota bacterium]